MNDLEALTLVLVPENGSFSDRRVVIVNQPIPVGRAADTLEAYSTSFLKFSSSVVSRQHCRLLNLGGKFFIQDTKSSSGTFLNGERLSPARVESKQYELHDGDIIKLGESIETEGVVHQAIVMRVCLPKSPAADGDNISYYPNDTATIPDNDLQAAVESEFETIWSSLITGIDTPIRRIRAATRLLSLANLGPHRSDTTISASGARNDVTISARNDVTISARSDTSTPITVSRSDTTGTLPALTRTLTTGTAHGEVITPVNRRSSFFPSTSNPALSAGQQPSANDPQVSECLQFIERMSWETPELKAHLIQLASKMDGQLIGFYKSLKGAPNSFVNVTTKYAKSQLTVAGRK